VITAKANLVAGTTCLVLTVWQENGDLWRYNLSKETEPRNGDVGTELADRTFLYAGRLPRAIAPIRQRSI
jgi:hypothetical protein